MTQQWKLVPVEPTEEMEAAAVGDYEQSGGTYRKSAYAAMLAAAPTPPASAQDDAKDKLTRDRIEEIARDVYKVERFTKDDEVWHNLFWLTSFAKAIEKELRRPAPAAGDARDAARLDWLEQHDGRFFNKDRISSIVGVGFLVAGDPQGVRHPNVRAAIDAARAASQQQEG